MENRTRRKGKQINFNNHDMENSQNWDESQREMVRVSIVCTIFRLREGKTLISWQHHIKNISVMRLRFHINDKHDDDDAMLERWHENFPCYSLKIFDVH